MHDDKITQEEFERAATMNSFPTITIPDPAAVGKWLDEQLPPLPHDTQTPTYGCNGWCVVRYDGTRHIVPMGKTPEDLLEDMRAMLAVSDPLAKLRKEAEAHGYALMKIPTD